MYTCASGLQSISRYPWRNGFSVSPRGLGLTGVFAGFATVSAGAGAVSTGAAATSGAFTAGASAGAGTCAAVVSLIATAVCTLSEATVLLALESVAAMVLPDGSNPVTSPIVDCCTSPGTVATVAGCRRGQKNHVAPPLSTTATTAMLAQSGTPAWRFLTLLTVLHDDEDVDVRDGAGVTNALGRMRVRPSRSISAGSSAVARCRPSRPSTLSMASR